MTSRFLMTLLTLGLASAASADSLPPPQPSERPLIQRVEYKKSEYEQFNVHIYVPRHQDINLFSQTVENNLITVTLAYTLANRTEFGVTMPPYIKGFVIPGLSDGDYTLKVVRLETGSSEVAEEDEVLLSIEAGPEPIPVYGMFHTEIEHFFITADTEERDFINQYGWNVIDKGFNAWPSEGDAPESALPVCRFYSEKVNSHFYTLDEEECEFLKDEQHGWTYEGIAFKAIPPVSGVCAEGTEPVWRLFNPRTGERQWEGQWIKTVNHRFTTDQNIYQVSAMAAFQAEGVAFCSPEKK